MPFDPDTADVQKALSDVVLQGEIARGGQKLVFLAESPSYGSIAVKLIKPGSIAADQRAEREIEVAKSLGPPHFPRLFEAKRVSIDGSDVICIYEEYLQGMSLRSAIQQNGRLSGPETTRIAVEVLEALETLRTMGVVHRDVKPDNIHIGADGRVVLLDLGIARQLGEASLTDDHAFFGPLTPGYGAPEQVRNEKRKISSRTDIFAIGVVMYECISGRNPFLDPGASPAQALQQTLTHAPPRLDAQGSSNCLANVVAMCMEKPAHRRFASPESVLKALKLCPETTE